MSRKYTVIKQKNAIAIVCGGKPVDHKCNEDATVFYLRNGERKFFKNIRGANKFYNKNYKDIMSGSCACSICQRAPIDDAPFLF
jgi:hypothetical protein